VYVYVCVRVRDRAGTSEYTAKPLILSMDATSLVSCCVSRALDNWTSDRDFVPLFHHNEPLTESEQRICAALQPVFDDSRALSLQRRADVETLQLPTALTYGEVDLTGFVLLLRWMQRLLTDTGLPPRAVFW
jgi:hypothetical protein